MNMNFKRKLPIPLEIKRQIPLGEEYEKIKLGRDETVKNIISGKDKRLLLIIGPCSADSEAPVLDYLTRLAKVSEEVSEKIFIVPRMFTAKPRSTSDGYLGMLHQPDPDMPPDLLEGVYAVRKLHIRAIHETGLSCADELLYPEHYRYFSDLLSYVSVGARSSEDQQHRLTASGLDIAVGMKNPTSGDESAFVNSVSAAQHPHIFAYRGWEVETSGNPFAHGILRGYVGSDGKMTGNCGEDSLLRIAEKFLRAGLENPALIIDTNHANSGKNHLLQEKIAEDVLGSVRKHPGVLDTVRGFMVESYLEDGNGEGYGRSITDPCLGWEKTERFIYSLAGKI